MTQQEFKTHRENFLKNENGVSSIQLFNGLNDFGTKLIHNYEISFDEKRDLLQHALIVAFKNMAFYKEEYQFTTWFGTILKNKVIDHLRKKNSFWSKNVKSLESYYLNNNNGYSPMRVQDDSSCPLEKMNTVELYTRLEKCIALVKNDKKRRILEMYFIEGKGNSEIIIELKEKKQMVNVTIHRFREKMKVQLNVLFNK